VRVVRRRDAQLCLAIEEARQLRAEAKVLLDQALREFAPRQATGFPPRGQASPGQPIP
jgi:hypothetical protein